MLPERDIRASGIYFRIPTLMLIQLVSTQVTPSVRTIASQWPNGQTKRPTVTTPCAWSSGAS